MIIFPFPEYSKHREKYIPLSKEWWFMLLIPVHRKLRQEN
jgi:hypothetical protein